MFWSATPHPRRSSVSPASALSSTPSYSLYHPRLYTQALGQEVAAASAAPTTSTSPP